MPLVPAHQRLVFDGVPSGPEVMRRVREETDTILLSFSCGKDSILAWLELRELFPRIIPFYMYLVPDLEFVEQSLVYYERFFGTRIIRVPHPSLYRMLRNCLFQPPERCEVIEAADLLRYDYRDLAQAICEDVGVPESTLYATGVRAADSPNRMVAMKQYGPLNRTKQCFYPVWDVRKAGLIDAIRKAGVKLPIDYRLFGRSFDGLDYRFLAQIRRHLPRDYARILEWFPLADLALKRYDWRRDREQAKAVSGGR